MPKTLLTGATGFIGSAVLLKLIDAGHDIRVLVRSQSNRQNLAGLNLEIVTADLRDRRSLKKVVQDCSILYHVAADYRLWVPRPQCMYETNVNGTVNLLRAAAEAGVRRIVYTSSVAVLGLHRDGTSADENTPSSLNDMIGHYKRSKYLAEAEVRRMVREEGLPAVIVNPSTPVGPRDIKPTPTGRMIVDAATGRMPAYVETGLNMVHVDDVAEGHLLAMERGVIGERYILGGFNMTLKQILLELEDLTGHPAPAIRLSPYVVLPIAYIAELLAIITGRGEPLVTSTGVLLARKRMFFSCQKAIQNLGYHPRAVKEGLRDAIRWFRQHDYIKSTNIW